MLQKQLPCLRKQSETRLTSGIELPAVKTLQQVALIIELTKPFPSNLVAVLQMMGALSTKQLIFMIRLQAISFRSKGTDSLWQTRRFLKASAVILFAIQICKSKIQQICYQNKTCFHLNNHTSTICSDRLLKVPPMANAISFENNRVIFYTYNSLALAMEGEQQLHHQDTLIQLGRLSEQISNISGREGADAFKRFIDFYVNHQKISEDFFIALCEHNVLGRLFTSKGISALEILEIFNLLLSNSSKQPQLVFIFSQATLHEFLFTKFLIEKESTEAIEYYVQLLKTIILKISSPETHSLIKLFCNNRYPHFPLLTTVATLAVSYEQEELVRVTANQCVLLLINLMNQTKIGLEYLSQLQMVVYYHQIARTMMEGSEEIREESAKFVVDLVLALKDNVVSQCILMNLITNQLFFRNIEEPQRILHFLGNFYDQMSQNPLFPAQLCQTIIFVLFRIMSKYYSQNNINYTYFTAQRIIPQIVVPSKPGNLQKYYYEKCSKIQEHLIRESPMLEDQKELELILEQWLHFNHKNKEISPLRRNQGQKTRSAFQEFFTSKEQLVEDYLQSIMTLAGLHKEKIKTPIHKLSYTADFQTALYLVEYVCSRYQETSIIDMKRAYEHYTKDETWQIKIKEEILTEIYQVCCRVEKAQESRRSQRVEKLFGVNSRVSSSRIFSSSRISNNNERPDRIRLQRQGSEKSIEQCRGFNYFLNHLKPELCSLFCASLTIHQLRPELSELSLISAISAKARLSEHMQPNHINLLLSKLKQLQDYITEDVLTQQNYHFVFKYISKSREKCLLRRLQKKQSGDVSPKKMFHNVKTRIQKNFIQYEVIKKLINPSIKTLSQFLRQFWQCRFFTKKDNQSYAVTQFLYKDSNGVVLEVIADHNYEFVVKKSKNEHESVTFKIGRDDCNYDKNNSTFLTFDDHKFWIDLETEEKANDFREDLKKLRIERRQLIMNGILEYLTFSFQSAANVAYMRLNKKPSLVTQQ